LFFIFFFFVISLIFIFNFLEIRNKGRIAKQDSKVSFAASQIKPPTYEPDDMRTQAFVSVENLECYPLLEDTQVAAIVMSYERAVDMLNKTKHIELATQAMHELGNVMYHTRNIRWKLLILF